MTYLPNQQRDTPPAGRPLEAILLAAGESRRMGEPKLRLPFRGSTIFETCIQVLIDAGVNRVIAVLGFDRDLKNLLERHSDWDVTIVFNENPERGMLSSAQVGALHLMPEADFMVALADQPAISASTVRMLMERFSSDRPPVLRARFGGKRGHPVFFRSDLQEELCGLPDGATLRDLVHAHHWVDVDVADDAIHLDIDDPAGYQAALTRRT